MTASSFGELLRWHFLRGTRPAGKIDHPGRKWTVEVFAAKVGVGDRTIRYWLRNEHLPPDIETIERVLFGNIETIKGADIYAEWRLELRQAHAKSSDKGGGEAKKRNSLSLRRTENIIMTEFKKSNAIFTVSSEQTLIVAARDKTFFDFKNLICGLYKIDDEDEKQRILVWILKRWNPGPIEVTDKLRYENVQSLILRFKALSGYFREQATWEWLKSRAVVAIQDAPHRLSQHILFGEVPNKWMRLLEFNRLYGDDLSRVGRASYTVFLRFSVNSPSKKDLGRTDKEYHLRYFGHAKIPADGEDSEVRGAELPSPGRHYDQAFAIVHAAATHFLKLGSREEDPNKGKDAEGKLRVLGFSLMRVADFVNL